MAIWDYNNFISSLGNYYQTSNLPTWDYNNFVSGLRNINLNNNTPTVSYTPDDITRILRQNSLNKTIGNTSNPSDTSNSFWGNFASGLGSNLLSGIGSIWNGYNDYRNNRANLALAKEQLALQKENYYNNERRLEANFQDVQQARRASRL